MAAGGRAKHGRARARRNALATTHDRRQRVVWIPIVLLIESYVPMQPTDHYEKTPSGELREPRKAQCDASKEFVTRLKVYGERLGGVKAEAAVHRVVEGILGSVTPTGSNPFAVLMEDEDQERRERHRGKLTTDVEPMVAQIIAMEKRWFGNVCKAHESAVNHLRDNQDAFAAHVKADGASAKSKLERLLRQQKTTKGWTLSVRKGQELARLESEIQKATSRMAAPQKLFDNSYFEGLRQYLRGAGFIVAPSYLPPAAVFPREDWIALGFDDVPHYDELVKQADVLMQKYHVLGTPYAGVLYNTSDPSSQTACGCVCVSWVAAMSAVDQERVLVPFLGLSGGAPRRTNVAGIEAMLGACALPPYGSMLYTHKKSTPGLGEFDVAALGTLVASNPVDPVLNNYYDDIMARANNLAINYRVRELLKLRLPSRQAMLSYLGLSFFVASREQLDEHATLVEPTPGIARWHSLNCAEPAALAWIASFFVDGQDVHLCCPYEGMDDPGALGLKPKETCPWCATVEIAYRSLEKVPARAQPHWSSTYESSMKTGTWKSEITLAQEFTTHGEDSSWRENLPRNKAAFALAYPNVVNSNVAILRKLFREVGILEDSTSRVGKPALWQQL